MTRITAPCSGFTECSWTKANQERIERHPAWFEDVGELQAEAFLEGKELFTYLLRKGEKENAYFISFVKEDLTIKHQRFTLEYDRKGWYYKNGTGHGPIETIEELIPQMMHCNAKECKILDHIELSGK